MLNSILSGIILLCFMLPSKTYGQFYDNPDYKVFFYYNSKFLGQKVNRFYPVTRPLTFLNKFFIHCDSVTIPDDFIVDEYYTLDEDSLNHHYSLESLDFRFLYNESSNFKDFLKYSQFWYKQIAPKLVKANKKKVKLGQLLLNCIFVITTPQKIDVIYICWDGTIIYNDEIYLPNRLFLDYLQVYCRYIEFDESSLPVLPFPKLR